MTIIQYAEGKGYCHPFGLVVRRRCGHWIIKKRGRWLDKWLHRAVVELLLEENPIVGWERWSNGIPSGRVVHHQDFNGGNNEPGNLILMPWQMHSKASVSSAPRGLRGRFRAYNGRRSKDGRLEL